MFILIWFQNVTGGENQSEALGGWAGYGRRRERNFFKKCKKNWFPWLPAAAPSLWLECHSLLSPCLPCCSLVLQRRALCCPACPQTAPAPAGWGVSCTVTGTWAGTPGLRIPQTAVSRNETGLPRGPWAFPRTEERSMMASWSPLVVPKGSGRWTGFVHWRKVELWRGTGLGRRPDRKAASGWESHQSLCGTRAGWVVSRGPLEGTHSWAALEPQWGWPWGRCRELDGWLMGMEAPECPGCPYNLVQWRQCGGLWNWSWDKPGGGSLESWRGMSWEKLTATSQTETMRSD